VIILEVEDMVKALIRMGDMTTHGGKVIEGFSDYTIQNIPVAGVGHKTICPLCKGVFPIIQGYGGITVNGIFVALEGHVTACGAKLIPSQHEEVVDDGGGGDVMGAAAQQPEQTQYARLSDNQRSMINDGVYRPDQDQGGISQIAAEDEEFRSENDPIRRGLERNDPNSDLNLGLREQFDRINRANKELNKPFYSEMRSPDDPYTEDDIGRLSRKADHLEDEVRLQEQRLERMNKLKQESQNKPPLKFENFDKQDLLKQSECSPQELENNLRFLEQSKRIKPGSLENFRRTGKWPENQPIPARPGNLTPEGDYDWDQAPQNGFLLDSEGNPIQEPVVPKAGDTIDRYGGEGGRFASPMDDPNNPIPYEQRSLPYVRDPSAYHRYRFNGDMSNFRQWVENSDPQTREDIEKYMRDYGVTYNDLARKGPIAPAFGESGGGTQYQFGIPLNLLRRSGILTEIPN